MQKLISRAQAEPEGEGEPNQTKPRTGGQPNKPNKTQNQPPQGEGEGRLPTADMPKQDMGGISVRDANTQKAPWGKTCSELAECQESGRGKGEPNTNRNQTNKPNPNHNRQQPNGGRRSPALCRCAQWEHQTR